MELFDEPEHAPATEPPRLDNFDEFVSLCTSGPDEEFWRTVAIGFATRNGRWPATSDSGYDAWVWAIRGIRDLQYEASLQHCLDKGLKDAEFSETEEERDEATQSGKRSITEQLNLFLKRLFQGDEMATKTATAKPKTKQPVDQVESDDDLLAKSLSWDGERLTNRDLAAMQESGAEDSDLLHEIQVEWTSINRSVRNYINQKQNDKWGMAIWFDDDFHDGAPPYACTKDGSLLKEVRRVLGITNPLQKDKPESKTAKPAKPGRKPKVADVPAGVELGPIEKRPVVWFTPSPWQERDEASEEWLDELASSLKKAGQLEAVIARPTGELISGHTRVQAATRAELGELDVRIVECDDAAAQTLVLFYNTKRKDLTLRERCRHYNRLRDSYNGRGLTVSELAADLEMHPDSLSNELRLASLPDELWERQEAGGLSVHQTRRLSTYAARPLFVKGFIGYLKTVGIANDVQPLPVHFESAMSRGIDAAFRTLKKDMFGNGCLFKVTPAIRKELDIVDINGDEMAGNVELWDRLNGEAKEKAKQKETAATTSTQEKAPLKAAAKVKEDDRQRRREHFLAIAWDIAMAAAITDRFSGKPKRVDTPLVLRLAMLVQLECGHDDSMIGIGELTAEEPAFHARCLEVVRGFFDVDRQHAGWTELDSEILRQLTAWLELAPEGHWKPTLALLETCSDDELIGFLQECDSITSDDRRTNVESLSDIWQAGWVPDQFLLMKSDAKKGKR